MRRLWFVLAFAGPGCNYLLPSLQTPPNCIPGTVLCNNLTCSDLRTDPYNCGFCGNACGQGLSCKYTDGGFIDGGYSDAGRGWDSGIVGIIYLYSACLCTIPEEVFWNGACYDLTNDPLNCGAIGQSCSATQACINGGCSCAGLGADQGAILECASDAGPVCTDLRLDPHHCGFCTNDCGANADCDGGVCILLDAGPSNDGGLDAGLGDGGDGGLADAGGIVDAGDGGDGGP